MLERDLTPEWRQLLRVHPLAHGGLGGQQLAQLAEGGLALLVGVVQLHHLLNGREECVEVEDEGGELADRQAAAEHHVAADQQDERLASDTDDLGAGSVEGADAGRVVVRGAVVADDVAVVADVVTGPVVRGDDAHAREALLQMGQHLRDAVAHLVEAPVGRSPEPEREHGHGGHDREHRDGGQRDVQREQHDGDENDGEGLHHHLHHAVLEQLCQRVDVARHAGHQAARLLSREELERQPLEVGEDADAEREEQTFAHPPGPRGARVRRDPADQHRREVEDGDGRENCGVAPADSLVDADLGEQRARLRRGRLQPDEHERGEHRGPVGPDEATERERPSVVVDLAERDPLDRVLGLTRQHLVDARLQLRGDAREREAPLRPARRSPGEAVAAGAGAGPAPRHQTGPRTTPPPGADVDARAAAASSSSMWASTSA